MAEAANFAAAWPHAKPANIVVAEDDPEMRRVVVELLREEGHDVDEVSDGAALVIELARRAALQRPRVDLIVSDVRMPSCTGLSAIETVRRFYGDVPVLLLTSFPDRETHERANDLGATIIEKPVRLSALRGVVAGLLRQRRRHEGVGR